MAPLIFKYYYFMSTKMQTVLQIEISGATVRHISISETSKVVVGGGGGMQLRTDRIQ